MGIDMNRKYRLLFWLICVIADVAALLAGAYFFFGGKDFSMNQKENSYLIGASYMTMNNEFYTIMSEEITDRVEAEGDRMILRDPALNLERQIQQINDMLDMGIDLLILTPVDVGGLNGVLRRAREEGVYVVVLDTNVDDEELVDCTITSDNYQAGVLVGEYFLAQNEKADIIVMTHEATKSGQDRVDGFLDTVLQNENMKVAEEIECEGQLEIAMPALQQAIDGGVVFDSVFCLNDLSSVGVAAALDENGLLGEIQIYGVDGSPDAKALIAEEMMEATSAQFPSEIGKAASDAIYSLLNGEAVEKNILVPVQLITRDNVEQFGVDRWQ